MSNLMQGTPWNEGDAIFKVGDHVRTVEVSKPSTDWTQGALKSRRWYVSGRVHARHDSHGVTYLVRHDDDGSIGHYEPRELCSILEAPDEKPVVPAKAEWEKINFETSRLKVPNGWLYRTRSYKAVTHYENFPNEYAVTSETTTFVPDPLPTTTVP